MRKFFLSLICLVSVATYARDTTTTFLKVHFLYGSRPLKEYKDTEGKWFGGVLGGHVAQLPMKYWGN